jgi:hypothetical protein
LVADVHSVECVSVRIDFWLDMTAVKEGEAEEEEENE